MFEKVGPDKNTAGPTPHQRQKEPKKEILRVAEEKAQRVLLARKTTEALPEARKESQEQHPLHLYQNTEGAVLSRRFFALKPGRFQWKRPVVNDTIYSIAIYDRHGGFAMSRENHKKQKIPFGLSAAGTGRLTPKAPQTASARRSW
jgi:hypothetical protein